MTEIKAILLDIDGTLTNSKKEITPKTLQALLSAQDHGVKLVIASGRPAKGLKQYGDLLNMWMHHGLFVAYNGARIIDCETQQVLVDTTMPKDLVTRVLEHMKKFDVIPMVTYGEFMVVEDVYHCMVSDYGREFNVIQYESRMNNYKLMEVEDLCKFTDFPVNKILTAGDAQYLQEHYKEMRAPFEDELSMMFTANFYYEFTANGINKGSGLKVAMEKLGIRPEECIAFGDAENDISMLEYAGIGVAMGNATDQVKAIADEITLSNEEDGIAHSLYKHLPYLS